MSYFDLFCLLDLFCFQITYNSVGNNVSLAANDLFKKKDRHFYYNSPIDQPSSCEASCSWLCPDNFWHKIVEWCLQCWLNLWMNGNFFNIRTCGRLTTFLGECREQHCCRLQVCSFCSSIYKSIYGTRLVPFLGICIWHMLRSWTFYLAIRHEKKFLQPVWGINLIAPKLPKCRNGKSKLNFFKVCAIRQEM